MFRGLSVSVSSFVSKDLSDKNSKKSNPKNQNHLLHIRRETNSLRTIERVREKEREREKRVRARGKE